MVILTAPNPVPQKELTSNKYFIGELEFTVLNSHSLPDTESQLSILNSFNFDNFI
jgi:hypothetical protein